MTQVTYDICYQLRGDQVAGRVLKTVKTEAEARKICAKLSNFPASMIQYVITCDDGRTIHDSRKDGLL